MTISVLLADDQEMVRTGFRHILSAEPDITVVGEAATGVEAVRLARELRPDVVLMDIRMPELDGLEATRQLAGPRATDPLRVVVVTTFDLDEYVYGALRGGACGFLLKDAGPRLLIEAVRAAAAGDALVSPSVTVRLLQRMTRSVSSRKLVDQLSARELEVVRAVAGGRTNAEIAAELFVSLSTVKSHVASAAHKLNARNRVEIAAWVWEAGLMHDRPQGQPRPDRRPPGH
ncbi:MAG: response regulator [Pseudonocardiaceae bacterium]